MILAEKENLVREDELINELFSHLQQIGVNATEVDSGSPEAMGELASFPLGCVKVEGRNIDLVQVERESLSARQPNLQPGEKSYTRERAQGSMRYDYHYLVRAKVAGLENKLKAELKPIEKRKGLFGKEIVGYQWEGEELAKRLNSDADLKKMLLKGSMHRLSVVPEKEHDCVRITPPPGPETIDFNFGSHPLILGRKMFPTRETFGIYDKVAQHVRGLAGPRP